jgi:glycine/betaine/sarcosine/D-proline reductase family selenoprotein B
MAKVRVMHYLNQFFAGIGGEDKADVSVGSLKGAAGPGKRLQELFKDSASIVVTAYCGDNYFSTHQDEALASILKIAKEHDVKILVAGPAFSSGRYGSACIEVCHFVSTSFGLECVTGMSIDNPGIVAYKQYKDRKVFAFPSRGDVGGMEDALLKIAQGVSRLSSGSAMGPASEEGYIPRGLRVVELASERATKRAIDMLLNKVAGRPFATEIPVEIIEATPIAPRVVDLKKAHIAIASTAGVHPLGNPLGFKPSKNTKWAKYPIEKLNSMKDAEWMVIHCGITCVFMLDNPNFGAPLDALREIEKEGVFAKLNPTFYSTTGVMAMLSDMKAVGADMASKLKSEGVNGVLLVST